MYEDVSFPNDDRPYYFSNFVETLDGKVQVTKDPKAYWPLGSQTDYQTLLELRAHADVIVHGRNTAEAFDTLASLTQAEFQARRRQLGKTRDLLYVVVSGHPGTLLLNYLSTLHQGVEVLLVTTNEPVIDDVDLKVIRFGQESVDLAALDTYLHEQKYSLVLLEGGPTLLGSFLAADLVDEVFVTIAPKIIGNEPGATLTMVEGVLFPPEAVRLSLVSVKQVEDEVYLRYRLKDARDN